MAKTLPKEWAEANLPIFKVFPERGGIHPPVALDRPVCVIGRDADANLPLDAPQVSRHHALVVRGRGGVYIRDLASTNGVLRNGVPVREAPLSDDDKLRVGSFMLRCSSGFRGRDYAGLGLEEDDIDVDVNEQVDRSAREKAPQAEAPDESGAAAGPSAPPAPAAELRVGDKVVVIPPGQHTVLIGRRDHCELRLEAPGVAPVHAVVFELDGARHVRDLHTPGGTQVNGKPVHKQRLDSGDTITVGEVTIEYREQARVAARDEASDEAPTATAPEPPEMSLQDSGIALADDSMARVPLALDDARSSETAAPERAAPPVGEDEKSMPTPQPKPVAAEPLAPDDSAIDLASVPSPATPSPGDVLGASLTDSLIPAADREADANEASLADATAAPIPVDAGDDEEAPIAVASSEDAADESEAEADKSDAPLDVATDEDETAAPAGDVPLPELETVEDRLAALTTPSTDEPSKNTVAADEGPGEDEVRPVAPAPAAAAAADQRDAAVDENRRIDKTNPDDPNAGVERITTLVEDLAETAATLKEVWKEHRDAAAGERDGDGERADRGDRARRDAR